MQNLSSDLIAYLGGFLSDFDLGRYSQTNRFFRESTQIDRQKRLVSKTADLILSWLFETQSLADDYFVHPQFKSRFEDGAYSATDILTFEIPNLLSRYQVHFNLLSENIPDDYKTDWGFALTKKIIETMKERKMDINKKGFDENTVGHLIFRMKNSLAITFALENGVDIKASNFVGESLFGGLVDFLGNLDSETIVIPDSMLVELCLLHCKKNNLTLPLRKNDDSGIDPMTYGYYQDITSFKRLNSFDLEQLIKTIALLHVYIDKIQGEPENCFLKQFEAIAEQYNKLELFNETKIEFFKKLSTLGEPCELDDRHDFKRARFKY